ncbi:RNA polymerase sigma-70 factor [Mariniflexile litorale]|uniref:RNA polymerase sigma-70 factor n=1 Tax=Mariniflexile litorale TaxID=3045158 RepID=A0AAU7EJC1_9FLAO|nr:RNA polymerase sigma-70 factor [Mariniflexile sp. KMM 9835]MDQ8209971.1 RNA polymerase sigma-70 factor [Mariniflexile sp. KMM 9835]
MNSDKELIELLHQGKDEALSLIYKKYWQMMYLAAYNLVQDKEVCEDIVQDIFVDLWNKRTHLIISISLKSYLYTSTVYKVYDFFRKNKKLIKIELLDNFSETFHALTPETKLLYEELIEHVDSIIEHLPLKCKAVFKLSREQELSNKEIADKLHISQRTVEGHITKALSILRYSMGMSLCIEFVLFIVKIKNN